MDLQTLLIRTIAIIGLSWYYICLIHLGLKPTSKGKSANGFRQFQSLTVTTISVSLATYVGFVIGLKGTTHVPVAYGATSVETSSPSRLGVLEQITNTAVFGDLQLWSAGLYVLSLVIALGFYAKTQDETEPAITGLAKSLLGFVAGVLSITLGIQSTS